MLRLSFVSRSQYKLLIFVAACLLNGQLFALEPDPCGDVKGGWHGIFTVYSNNLRSWCTYEAKAEGTIYKSNIRLIVTADNGKPNDASVTCSNQAFIREGTCNDGDVVMNDGSRGSVFGGYLHIRYSNEDLILQKDFQPLNQ